MSIRVVHAKMDENGGIYGPIVGDQTGKEIFDEPFYLNDSVYLLICRDKAMAARALSYMTQIARDDAYGYSQNPAARWSGYKSIASNGGRVNGGSGSFDCASVIIAAYIFAGLKIKPEGYTGSMLNTFKATGMFDVYKGAPYTNSDKYAKAGCLYLRPKTNARGGHVFMAMQDGSDAVSMEDYSSEADQIDPPYVLAHGTVNVRKMAGKPILTDDMTDEEKRAEKAAHAVIYTTKKGEKLPFGEYDGGTEWYGVETPRGLGFISNNKRYTKLVVS